MNISESSAFNYEYSCKVNENEWEQNKMRCKEVCLK